MSAPVATTATVRAEVGPRGLDQELERLRLLLARRVLWLRAHWADDPLAGHAPAVVSDMRADRMSAPADPSGERAFQREHPPAAALTAELEALEAELEAARSTRPGPLDRLTESFDLTRFERDVLVLCAAPELDAGFQDLYAYVQDDPAARRATPALALSLLPWAERAVLDAQGTLRRFRLVVLDDPPGCAWPHRPLRMDERMLDHLRGSSAPDERVRALAQPLSAPAPVGPDVELVGRLARELGRRGGAGIWPALNLTGPAQAGKRGVALTALALMGLRLVELDARAADPDVAPGLLSREAALRGLAYLIAVDPGDTAAAELRLADRLEAPLVVLSEQPLTLARDLLSVRLERPDSAGRAELWRHALGPATEALDLDALVQQFEIGAGAIADAARDATGRARLRTGEADAAPSADDLWAACRERARPQMGSLARRLEPSASWDDLVLPQGTADQLDELAAQARQRGRVYDEWGFGQRLGRGRGITAMFAGPSGTGKTMAAEVLAVRLGLDIFKADLANLVSKYIGETEKNLRRVFDSADDSGAILFFDEAEALFGKRTEVRDSHDRYANIEVDYLLQRMEDYRGIAILATNRKHLLDTAFLRRLRFVLDFPFPDARARRLMWERAFPADTPVADLDFDALARLELAGGSISTIVLNAAFLAASDGGRVGMAHIRAAARREYAKLGKLVDEDALAEETA